MTIAFGERVLPNVYFFHKNCIASCSTATKYSLTQEVIRMSTVQNTLWTKLPAETLDSKYEKCRNITEEIYKRINITFQIKKLETNTQSELSDCSDQIDSNELSNETDLFACDKSSISSSTELEALEQGSAACEKFINNNNNEEKVKKTAVVYKRPRKRFRKRVKKQQSSKKDSDGSSDEAIPLSRVAVVDNRATKSPLHAFMGVPNVVITPIGKSDEAIPLHRVVVVDNRATKSPLYAFMGVPNVVITPIDLKKLKLSIPEIAAEKKSNTKHTQKKGETPKAKSPKVIDKTIESKRGSDKTIEPKRGIEILPAKEKTLSWSCSLCSCSFKGERGLRRHMTMSHIISPEDEKKLSNAREDT
ncbi:uncharacterized protein LOC112050697 [Bicyclus anynana]|uniref:Uncharacterized protein LOC112050697 n=1 Tax=Bicyclus anynana TaxID=110368 RepID=A0ABM3M3Q9_BICAN|nr:uncharacterized protein LOC112050697 [Bicyclus anynana]